MMITGILDNTLKPVIFCIEENDYILRLMTYDISVYGQEAESIVINSVDGFLFGTTHDNHRIAFDTGNIKLELSSVLSLKVGLYILSAGNYLNRDFEDYLAIAFEGGSLNSIFCADRIVFNPASEPQYTIKNDSISFSFDYQEESFKIYISSELSFSSINGGKRIDNSTVTLTIRFDNTQSLSDFIKYYRAIKKTLSFMCFRKNIGFERIVIKKRSEQFPEILEDFGIVYFNDERNISVKDWQTNICVKDLGNSFIRLFELFYLHDDSTPIISFIPENDNDVYRITPYKIKEICSAIEYEYSINIKEKTQDDLSLIEIKNDVITLLSDYKKSHSDFSQSSYDLLISSIEKWSLSLRDRIMFLFHKYKAEIETANYTSSIITDDEIKQLVKYRNNVTHSNTSVLSSPLADTAFVLQVIVYCSVLDRIGLSREEIKSICKYKVLR